MNINKSVVKGVNVLEIDEVVGSKGRRPLTRVTTRMAEEQLGMGGPHDQEGGAYASDHSDGLFPN